MIRTVGALFAALLISAPIARAESAEDFVAPYRAHLGEPLLASNDQSETYRAIVIPAVDPAFSVRVDVQVNGSAILTVKRLRGLEKEFKGLDTLGRRTVSPAELSALRAAITRVDFWNLATEVDNTAESKKWSRLHPEPEPVPAPTPPGRTYTPNEPLSVVCMDSTETVLEAAASGRAHAVYRDCGFTHVTELERVFLELARPFSDKR